jgi:hypothetical protein
LAAHFAKRNTKFGGGGKARAGKNSFPPTPFLFARPSVRIRFSRAKRDNQSAFRSKNVRAESYNSTNIKLSDFSPTNSAAQRAASYGKMGFPRASRAAKRRFEIPCDFKYLLCPIKN